MESDPQNGVLQLPDEPGLREWMMWDKSNFAWVVVESPSGGAAVLPKIGADGEQERLPYG